MIPGYAVTICRHLFRRSATYIIHLTFGYGYLNADRTVNSCTFNR